MPRIPLATYRFQFNKNFTFTRAKDLVAYLHRLGISDCYSSPFFAAAADSPHGYDICNHNELNPDIGSREEFDAFVDELHRHEMGQVVDFVPNHMGIAEPTNGWWMDVLENGRASRFAAYFDIDWEPVKQELQQKVLLPILGDQYGRVLEAGEFSLSLERGSFFVQYYDIKFPVDPGAYPKILHPALEILGEDSEELFFAELQSIINSLQYLPSHNQTDPQKMEERAREKEIAKRRLATLCSEYPPALEAIHRVLRKLEGEVGDPRKFDSLHELLEAQVYRLSYWRVASEEINYRRFFDINNLAALRMEKEEVFEDTHRLIFELIDRKAVTGLRIDHPDGLLSPREYFEQLQLRHAKVVGLEPARDTPRNLYVLAEKILTGNERLSADWPVHGTTGYDFTRQVTQLYVDSEAEGEITDTYYDFIGLRMRFDDLVYDQKRLVMLLTLASEVNALGHILNVLSERNRWYRDFTLNSLTTAVREVIASFPIYRTYRVPGEPVSPEDQWAILLAIARAKRRNPAMEASVFNFLEDNLLFRFPENIDEATREEHFRFVMKFQQTTGPIMAKGLEDTAFYIYNRLAALNEVGGSPRTFGTSAEEFHRQSLLRHQEWPHSMLSTSTHDSKRSEDVRARIVALSEIPDTWKRSVDEWSRLNAPFKSEIEGEMAPDFNEEYLLYQTILGTWPIQPLDNDEYRVYIQRIQDYMTKAIKEAKINTSWIQPFEEWDNAVRGFVFQILEDRPGNPFLKSLEPVARQIAELGCINGLSQLLLKLSVPGVPDIYQGNEIWDFSLVDPDNRRPVDYEKRRQILDSIENADPSELLNHWRDGRIKMFLTRAMLHFRRENPELFRKGRYAPLETKGTFSTCCLAFVRQYEEEVMIVVAPRLTRRIGFPPLGEAWKDTSAGGELLSGSEPLTNLFTGETIEIENGQIQLSRALSRLPFAVFTSSA